MTNRSHVNTRVKGMHSEGHGCLIQLGLRFHKPDLDILVLLDVGAFDSQLACVRVEVDGLNADGEHGAHS